MDDVRKKIILVSGYGHRNHGDDAQSLSAAARLCTALPEAEISMAINNPYENDEIPGCTRNPLDYLLWRLVEPRGKRLFNRLFGVFGFICQILIQRLRVRRILAQGWFYAKTGLLCTFSKDLRQCLRIVRSGDLLYMSGGGHYNDIWFWESLITRMIIIRFFHNFNKPVVISGQGVGPLQRPYGRKFLKKSLRYVDTLTLRDPSRSERLLREIGVRGPNIMNVGDDSLGLEPGKKDLAYALIRNASLDISEKIMGVNVRFATYHHCRHMLEYSVPTAAILDRMIEAFGVKILFFPSRFSSLAQWDDRDIAYRVIRHMRHWREAAVIHQEFDAAVCKALVACFRMFLGTAYHPCVFALTAGTPSVGLYEGPYYEAKIKGAFEFYGLENCAIEYSKATPERVEECFRGLLADPQSFTEMANKVTSELRRKIDVTITRTVELLGEAKRA